MPLAAIISKPQKPELEKLLPELMSWLEERGFDCIFDPESAEYLDRANDAVERPLMPESSPAVVISLGAMARCFLPRALSRRPIPPSSESISARSDF